MNDLNRITQILKKTGCETLTVNDDGEWFFYHQDEAGFPMLDRHGKSLEELSEYLKEFEPEKTDNE